MSPEEVKPRLGDRVPQHPSSRGRASVVHVDLGQDLKSAVQASASRCGMKPSDWVRVRLAEAVATSDAAEGETQGRARVGCSVVAASDPLAGARTCQLTLQSEDVEPLDRLVAAGGFRTRPAALRFLLRQYESPQTLAAFRELPRSLPALAESNVTLQLAVRMSQAMGPLAGGQGGLDSALRRDIALHMERASRVVGALQPLLAPRR